MSVMDGQNITLLLKDVFGSFFGIDFSLYLHILQ